MVGVSGVPAAEQFRGGFLNGGLVHGSDHRKDAVVGAVELVVELLDIVERHLLQLGKLLFARGIVERIAFHPGAQVARQRLGGKLRRLGGRVLQGFDALRQHAVEFVGGVGRFLQHFDGQAQRGHEVARRSGDVGAGAEDSAAARGRAASAASASAKTATTAAGDHDAGIQLLHLVGELLPRLAPGAAIDEAAGELRRGVPAGQRGFIAEAQIDDGRDHVVGGLLRQHHQLHAIGELAAHQAALNIGGRGVERFTAADDHAALVVFQQRYEIGCFGNHRAVGSCVGNVVADGAVRGLEVRFGDAHEVGRLDVLEAVVLQEHQPPVALRDGRVESAGSDGLRVGEAVLQVA